MPAYFIAELDTTNQAGMDPYLSGGPRHDRRNIAAAS